MNKILNVFVLSLYTNTTFTVFEKHNEQLETDLKVNLSDMAVQADVKSTSMCLCWAYFKYFELVYLLYNILYIYIKPIYLC